MSERFLKTGHLRLCKKIAEGDICVTELSFILMLLFLIYHRIVVVDSSLQQSSVHET
jgi:hypothetical protein